MWIGITNWFRTWRRSKLRRWALRVFHMGLQTATIGMGKLNRRELRGKQVASNGKILTATVLTNELEVIIF
jgi:hypothetical protein